MVDQNEIQMIHSYFKRQPLIVAVYLYGSKARGDDKDSSDIDLAVIFKKGNFNTFQLQDQLIEDLSDLLKTDVEVQNLLVSDIAFIYRVIQEGKNIYDIRGEQEHVEFVIGVIRQYFDLKPTYDQYCNELSSRIRGGVFSQ